MNDSFPVCEMAFNLTFHPIYRSSQYNSIVMLFLAVPPLFYFIFWKLIRSRFHGNLKWVLIGYFGSTLIFTLYYIWISLYQIIVPLFEKNKCSLIIGKELFKYGHLTAIVGVTIPMFIPFIITLERIYATKFAENYENTKVLIGPLLTILSILLDILAVAFVFQNEPFDAGSISFAFIPNTSAPRMFTFYWILFFLNLFNFAMNMALLSQNRKMKNDLSSLTARYQLEEVYLSTKFAVTVIFVHIVFLGVYIISVMFVRYYGYLIIEDSLTIIAIRGAMISMVAIYNFLIGMVAVLLFKRIQEKKIGEIQGKVLMKATGRAGAKNYEDAIFSVWNLQSSIKSHR